MLELKNVSKTYSRGTSDEKAALKNISLSVADGDFITIIGANGAGKSTLFGAISGAFQIDSGRIELGGKDITFTPEFIRSRRIGRLFQDPMKGTSPNMTVEENLALAAGHGGWLSVVGKKEKQLLREKVALLGMGLEDKMDKKVGSLSGGQRQAITLMMATVNPPELLLLDECTAALDPAAAKKVLEIINKTVNENKITCIMITHDMQMALDMGNRTLMMINGRIVMDISGGERKNMTVPGLLEKFRAESGAELVNDRMLLK